MKTRQVGIYIFDEVEVLDFAGPFEVFSTASRVSQRLQPDAPRPFEVCTIGVGAATVSARGGLLVQPKYSLENHPRLDVLVIPGGVVTRELERPDVVAWTARTAAQVELTAAVCTGAFILGKAGLLRGCSVTTHWEDIGDLRAFLSDTTVVEDARWIDEGAIVTSAGISAGVDMSLHLVARLCGAALATRTARQMEYDWKKK